MLITEYYRALNIALHARGHYGAGGARWAEAVRALRQTCAAENVLDYGCGQGTLRAELGAPEWMREYDPAIPGKDAAPEKADVVVCTDVLEHVEPECLDDVLKHIAALAGKAVFLNIATRPAIKHLADGRNAHLIVEAPSWWRAALEKWFRIVQWCEGKGELAAVVQPIVAVGELRVRGAVADDVRLEQARANCERVSARLSEHPRHDRRAIIACYGPSLRDTWTAIPIERAMTGALLVTVSGAHDWLVERGVVPDAHIEVDPRVHKCAFTRRPNPQTSYWLASTVHPDLVTQLKDHDVRLWHPVNTEESLQILTEIDPDGFMICGGGSVGCRAVNVLFTQGYRRMSIHGMDCSFDAAGGQHAGLHSGARQDETEVRCGDRWFRTSATWIAVARGFVENLALLERSSKAAGEPPLDDTDERIDLRLHGDGFLQHYCKVAAELSAAKPNGVIANGH
ncbi:MAG: DUF115 domain-containing protein [Armatimonadetes bacterium]|nr:DUF115 domain-containing protein [Armatimonadota bacterium]